MILNQQALDELKAIHKKNFNEDLTDEEAMAMGNRLLRLFSVILRVPAPERSEEELDEFWYPKRNHSLKDSNVPSSPTKE